MNILFALNHPAHYYLFKYILLGLEQKNHKVKIVIREKDILSKLLILENIQFTKLCERRKRNSNFLSVMFNGLIELTIYEYNLLKICLKSKYDCLLGTDIAITHIGRLLKIPSLVFNEDDYKINPVFTYTSYPFASYIVSPMYCDVGKYEYKKISYYGTQKLAYLHPRYYKPDDSILKRLSLSNNDTFFLIRKIDTTSFHHIYKKKFVGLDDSILKEIIKYLNTLGKIFITSETQINSDLRKYHLKIPVNKVHDLMAFAKLFIGDSQSMCTEAGILGTPYIRYNNITDKISNYRVFEQKYNLGQSVIAPNKRKLLEVIKDYAVDINKKEECKSEARKLICECIDLNEFVIRLIEHLPHSLSNLGYNSIIRN